MFVNDYFIINKYDLVILLLIKSYKLITNIGTLIFNIYLFIYLIILTGKAQFALSTRHVLILIYLSE